MSSAVCLLIPILRYFASLTHCKVVSYEKLEILMRSAVYLLSSVYFFAMFIDMASLIQCKVVRYEKLEFFRGPQEPDLPKK